MPPTVPLRVLSLFDGISCGRLALNRAGIAVETYFASEIDPHAPAISRFNHPEITRLGDVSAIDFRDLGRIDLLLGVGSGLFASCCPCELLAHAGNAYAAVHH